MDIKMFFALPLIVFFIAVAAKIKILAASMCE
jgi:hypothetical protein